MFEKKVTFEEFLDYKNEVEVELARLRDEVKALQQKGGFEKRVEKLNWSSSKSPVEFFKNILKHLYESDEVFYDNGNFYDGDGKFIAQRQGDSPLIVAKRFLTIKYAESFPPAKRVGKGFYKRAADLGVLYHGTGKGAYHTSLTSDEGETIGGLVIHYDFLNKYKNGGL